MKFTYGNYNEEVSEYIGDCGTHHWQSQIGIKNMPLVLDFFVIVPQAVNSFDIKQIVLFEFAYYPLVLGHSKFLPDCLSMKMLCSGTAASHRAMSWRFLLCSRVLSPTKP